MPSGDKPPTAIVKIRPATHARLQNIAKAQHRSMGEVVSDLIERYERDLFWDRVHEAVERLRADPEAWADYQREIDFFAGGDRDALEDEAPYFSPEEEEAIRAELARSEVR